jgi:hypothetical protein
MPLVDRLLFLALLLSIATSDTPAQLLDKFRHDLLITKSAPASRTLSVICGFLSHAGFVKASEDGELLDAALYELGFGVLGLRAKSWATRYQADPMKISSCYGTLHAIATGSSSKTPLADSRKIIQRCCPSKEL